MGTTVKKRTETERLYVELKPIENGDDFKELLIRSGSEFITDPLKLYITIGKKRKPDDFDRHYANILHKSRYDRKAKDLVLKFNMYLVDLYDVMVDDLYNEYSSYCVIKHKASDRYFRIDGNYSSYSGLDFYGQSWYEVLPVEVTNTEYHRM